MRHLLLACLVVMMAQAADTNLTLRVDQKLPTDWSTFANQTGPLRATFYDYGALLVQVELATNITHSRLTDLPNVLCTITNRVLRVVGPYTTNEVLLAHIGVGCEEVAATPPVITPKVDGGVWTTNIPFYNITPGTNTPTTWPTSKYSTIVIPTANNAN